MPNDDDAVASNTERSPIFRPDGDEADRDPGLRRIDLLYKAWGLIMNVKDSQTEPWRKAAADWLAAWHEVVNR